MLDSFSCRETLAVGDKQYTIASLSKFNSQVAIDKLPISLKILLENCLRREDGQNVTADDIKAIAARVSPQSAGAEIAFMPSRVLLQDFTGVPAVVDLAAMRDAMSALGGDPEKINPLQPVELVIDHSVQVDNYGTTNAMDLNTKLEFHRNKERYQFLRWGGQSFSNFKAVPPGNGIVHQVNLEYLARVVFVNDDAWAYPDTLVGTDSHTTMINGLGVLGWGVGGIEAEAAMLGQPVSMLIPDVIGFKLEGALPEGATATDLVLRVVEMLRQKGVVGKFVEFYGDGLSKLPLADRATIANMAPEYGATCGFFPIDDETLRYMRLSGRDEATIALTEQYAKEQGLFRTDGMAEAVYTDTLALDLSTVKPAIAGPKRPQDRIDLDNAKQAYQETLQSLKPGMELTTAEATDINDGSVVIAAITSCTNTSNPYVMLGAGLVAKKAVAQGLKVPAWVKTSLAPGSRVVTEYLQQANLLTELETLGFNVVGYGCTTCIGNSGPLAPEISQRIRDKNLYVCSVLSGNRNFEGRIHADIQMNYLASPPLVVAYALAGRMNIDFEQEAIGEGPNGPVYLRDIWPSQQEIHDVVEQHLQASMFTKSYDDVFDGGEQWNSLPVPAGKLYEWQADSTYVKHPPYFEGMSKTPQPVGDIQGARVLAKLADSVTTDHISPAGAIKADSPAGEYLQAHGVDQKEFNSYGSRRGNHEVMMRGTFANVRLRNQLAPGTEGGWTKYFPEDKVTTIFEASEKYRAAQVPLIILAGKEYGSGSSRDWAAKGPRLLGVDAVIAESFERIHRSNLVGMGILPLVYQAGESAESLGLSGEETYRIEGLDGGQSKTVTVTAVAADGSEKSFQAQVRLDTPQEIEYYNNGGILHYVLRQLSA